MRQNAEPLRPPREGSTPAGATAPPGEVDITEDVSITDPEIALPMTPPSSKAISGRAALQAVMLWRGRVLGYRLLGRREAVTVGPHKRATLVTPAVAGGRGRFKLAQPSGQGYLLRLAPGMRGDVQA